MKYILLALGLVVGGSALAPTPASAVVCARGVVRSGCAGPNGAAVRRHGHVVAPVRRCVWVTVNGVRVCR
jgi:hypothetical protein